MWEMSGNVAWGLSALIFLYLIIDFILVNMKYSEAVLTSSREGVDELFSSEAGEQQ
jgi:hypothetical protein